MTDLLIEVVVAATERPLPPTDHAARQLALFLPVETANEWRRVRREMEPRALKRRIWDSRN